MKLVEECHGIGTVTWRSRAYAGVPYAVSRYQAMTPGGLPVPGLHRIEGRLGIERMADRDGIEGASVTLQLEDGRSMTLTVRDDAGSVLAEGHGPGRCMCC